MNRDDHLGAAVSTTLDGSEATAATDHSRRSIARAVDSTALSARGLEERRLIHRNDSVRQHADAFRELRTKLLAAGDNRNSVILVAPVAHGCGGSFVARNLSVAFAFDETRSALLVDCDSRHPAQHAALDVEATGGGLMDYIDDPAMDISRIVYATGIPRLRLVPSGRVRETTGERFTSFRMRTMIDSLRSRFDDAQLIIDGPPVQGSPDARILSALADHVVLVAGYGRVTTEQINQAAANFEPEKLVGVVFNNTP
ncbi:CpsD/CapB family tyrosine-protein kinase [Luteimonas notoginsengisoli]|jgi:protein-tyrosine kinase|uniref:CpsD/CapB family tyrosine-protein kinase n=1 Tax=Luteimonas notoginsengisoli TaxID=1578200 RepID=A0ABV7UVU1_9GAMM